MKKLVFILLAGIGFICESYAQAPPSTEIYLFDLSFENGVYKISNPTNISDNEGYDNQPSFLPDNTGVLYSSTQNDQTDIVHYNISDQTRKNLSTTEGSEYSPTINPNGQFVSSILLEKDGTQLLYKYPLDRSSSSILVEDLKIGYHCWINDSLLVAFVLGEPSTLQLCNLATGQNKILDENIGRSLHRIPGEEKISYISKKKEKWPIRSLDPFEAKSNVLTETLEGSEDMAWSPEGIILQGKESQLFQNDPKTDSGWKMIADLSEYDMSGITRLAVSPDGKKITIVVNE